MKYELKRIEVWPVVKIIFVISLFLGFFISLLYAGLFFIAGVISSSLGVDELAPAISISGVVALFIVLFGTITVAVVYSLVALIFTALYNLVARWAGGFVVHFETSQEGLSDSDY